VIEPSGAPQIRQIFSIKVLLIRRRHGPPSRANKGSDGVIRSRHQA